MKSLSKKLLMVYLAVMLLIPNLHVFAKEPAARTLSVFRVDGDDAFLARALGGRGTEPREGQRLNLGNVMQTGLDTQVYMQLDAASIVKQDEMTYVAVSAAGNLLSLSVLRGSALVDVRDMEPEHRLETRIGSTVMSVRGTIFTASIRDNGVTVITMLSGEGAVFVPDGTGEVMERPLEAGYVFWAHDAEAVDAFDLRPIDPQAMNLFELREVLYRSEYLLEIGTITPEMQAQLPGLINQRQQERTTRLEARQTALSDFDGAPIAQAPLPQPPATQAQNQALVGTNIQFGGYDWRVLDVRGNRVLILSEHVISVLQYHTTSRYPVTWEDSDIRRYLNSNFFGRLSPQDQGRIAVTEVVNNDNQWFGTSGGNNTIDRVFLLSVEEVVRYFGDSGQLANRPEYVGILDEYSSARVATNLFGLESAWWLRSPGAYPNYASQVNAFGEIGMRGRTVHASMIFSRFGVNGVRPALWLYM